MKKYILLLIIIMIIPFNVIALSVSASNESILKSLLSSEPIPSGDENTNITEVKLNSDITVSENLFVNGDITLDLNGHTLNMGSKTIVPKKILTIKDSSSNGKIIGSNIIFQTGLGDVKGTLKLESGTIDGTGSYVIYNKGNVIVNGGSII